MNKWIRYTTLFSKFFKGKVLLSSHWGPARNVNGLHEELSSVTSECWKRWLWHNHHCCKSAFPSCKKSVRLKRHPKYFWGYSMYSPLHLTALKITIKNHSVCVEAVPFDKSFAIKGYQKSLLLQIVSAWTPPPGDSQQVWTTLEFS